MSSKKLSFTDRNLTALIFSAMVVGILLGNFVPEFSILLSKWQWKNTGIPLAIGLILMLYPPLARVKYEQLPTLLREPKVLAISILMNWILGPLLMFVLAWITLPDLPEYRNGVILIGIARCIAMVLVWNDLAGGNRELGAGLVAINSLFQLFTFSALSWFYLNTLPSWLGLESFDIKIEPSLIRETVYVFLGIPAGLGLLSWLVVKPFIGVSAYDDSLMPKIAPITLYALLFTIVVMFALKAKTIVSLPLDIIRVSLPLILYFGMVFLITFKISAIQQLGYAKSVALSVTATGNNFELAIAVAIGVFGISSGEAFAGVIGPLVEVPALLVIVNMAKALKNKWFTY